MLQAQAQGKEEVLRALRRHTVYKDIVAVGHAGHEHLRLLYLARLRVDVRHFVACEIHHQLLARLIGHG